jgi:signal peptidase I
MKPSIMKRFLMGAWEIGEVILISLATVLFIRNFLFQPFLVSGASMMPNFSDGDYLIVDEISYRFEAPKRGDPIVFRFPKDPKTYFIKRIIGLPGERVINQNGSVKIITVKKDTIVLPETYLPAGTRTAGSLDLQLGAGEYAVMGDNRDHSFDTRSWGPVPQEDIIGLVRLRIYPVGEAGIIDRPVR